MKHKVYCRICEQQLKRQGDDYYCPTCPEEIPFSEANITELSDDEQWAEGIENKVDLDFAIKRLPEREQKIARLLLEGYNQAEIAKETCLSEANVSRRVKDLTKKLLI